MLWIIAKKKEIFGNGESFFNVKVERGAEMIYYL